MLQRIQTLYLTASFLLLMVMFFVPLATISLENGGEYVWRFTSAFSGETPFMKAIIWPVSIMMIIEAFLVFAAIFLYTNRPLQMRLCLYNMILMVLFYVVFFLSYWFIKPSFEMAVSIRPSLFLSFSIIAVILHYLAIRAIGKDEALVRSLDRLR